MTHIISYASLTLACLTLTRVAVGLIHRFHLWAYLFAVLNLFSVIINGTCYRIELMFCDIFPTCMQMPENLRQGNVPSKCEHLEVQLLLQRCV